MPLWPNGRGTALRTLTVRVQIPPRARFRPRQLGRHTGMTDDYEYRWMTDESEAASGDNIVYADEGEWADEDDED